MCGVVKPWRAQCGSPATHLRHRFADEIINNLVCLYHVSGLSACEVRLGRAMDNSAEPSLSLPEPERHEARTRSNYGVSHS